MRRNERWEGIDEIGLGARVNLMIQMASFNAEKENEERDNEDV